MKPVTLFFALVLSLPIFSQTDELIGEYHLKLGGGDHMDEYTLTINGDGTFNFHSYRNAQRGIPPVVNKYGKGTWEKEIVQKFSTDYIVVTFFANAEKDFDEKHTLDFHNSKARLIKQSARNKKGIELKGKLQFFESKILWLKKVALLKT